MKRHNWKKNDYDDAEDAFGFESGFHNGPKCVDCGYSFCKHCHPAGYDTECGREPVGDPIFDEANIDPVMARMFR